MAMKANPWGQLKCSGVEASNQAWETDYIKEGRRVTKKRKGEGGEEVRGLKNLYFFYL